MPLIITIMTTSQVLRKSSPGPFSSVVCVLWRVTVEYNSHKSVVLSSRRKRRRKRTRTPRRRRARNCRRIARACIAKPVIIIILLSDHNLSNRDDFYPKCYRMARSFWRPPPSLLRGPGILKSHGNGQSGGSFRRAVRCGFVVSSVLHEFEDPPSPLKIDATC